MVGRTRIKQWSVIALASGLMLAAGGSFACDHDKESKATKADAQHQLHDHTTQQADAVGSKRFATNKHLRKAMSSIEVAYTEATRGQNPSKASARSLAMTVEEGIADIVKHCSLPKDADVALHAIIHEMSAAATQLKSGRSIAGASEQLGRALDQYRATFDHPLETAAHVH